METNRTSAVWPTVCILIFTLHSTALSKVIYVDDDAVGRGDGSSWADAYLYLQDALADANDSEKPVEIRVAQGVYKPDRGAGIEAGDCAATFRLLNGVMIKGGYAGPGEPDPNAWDPTAYVTILHGDLQDNDDYPNQASLYDNSNHIVTSVGVDETAVLDGFTVTQGAYLGTPSRISLDLSKGGAGLYNESGAPVIRRCVFSRNSNGGIGSAVLNHTGSAARFEECTFEENYHVEALADYQSHSVFQGCRFIRNYSRGIRQFASTSEINNCEFVENESTAVGLDNGSSSRISNCAFIANNGGAIRGSQVECRNCTFERNVSNGDGGAVRIDRGSFIDCVFRGNSADTKGALTAASLQLQRCVFVQNSARNEGAVACGEAKIHQCLFAGNQATQATGALFVRNGATISNCTFVGNRSAFNGIIDAVQATEPGVMTNCIFRNNTCLQKYAALIQPDSLMAVRYSSISDPFGWYQGRGEAIMDVDPLFVDPGYWDPNGTPEDPNDDFWIEGDYHLKSQAGRWDGVSEEWVKDDMSSPCIDTGDPNSPIGLEPFPNGGRINMGAYGGTAEASRSYFGEPVCETIVAGDINGDCRVDFRDLEIMARHWLEERGD